MKRNNSWKGWAIGAIWIGVGLSAFGAGMFTVIIALCAMAATDAIVESK
jgi:hypothetical protein